MFYQESPAACAAELDCSLKPYRVLGHARDGLTVDLQSGRGIEPDLDMLAIQDPDHFGVLNMLSLEYGREYGERFDWPDMNATCYGDSVFCYGLGDHFGILSDGSVIPCCLDSEGDITLGNIFEKPVNDILATERAVSIREGFKNRKATEELCKRCGYARRFG